jgi:hypothetical protein
MPSQRDDHILDVFFLLSRPMMPLINDNSESYMAKLV